MSNVISPEKIIQTTGKHLIIFYEESDYAKKLVADFLKCGLDRGHSCVYATDEPVDTVKRNLKPFFDLDSVQDKLQIFQHKPIENFDNIYNVCDEMNERILKDSQPPYQLVGRYISQIDTKQGIEFEINLEKRLNDNYDSFEGTVLCVYPYDKIESVERLKWIQKLIGHHHAVIFAPESGLGRAYENPDSKNLIHDTVLRVITKKYGSKVSMHLPKAFCEILDKSEEQVMSDIEIFHQGLKQMLGTTEADEVITESLKTIFYGENND